jgi:hypothetical protein
MIDDDDVDEEWVAIRQVPRSEPPLGMKAKRGLGLRFQARRE